MATLLTVLNALLPLLYLALLVDYGATFFLQRRVRGRSPWLVGCIAVHAAFLVLWTIQARRPPVANSEDILSVVALATAALYLAVELKSRDRRTGAFVLLLVFFFQYAASILLAGKSGGAEAPAEVKRSVWGGLHVMPALVAYTALGFAAVYGLLHILAQRELRGRRYGLLFDRLPPLESLGRMTWHVLLVGFVFMTISIAVSPLLFWHGQAGGAAEAVTAKVLAKIITGSVAWVLYAAAVLGRWLGKWSPVRVSWIAVIGFVVVMALIVASVLLS